MRPLPLHGLRSRTQPSFALPLESVTVCTFLAVFSSNFATRKCYGLHLSCSFLKQKFSQAKVFLKQTIFLQFSQASFSQAIFLSSSFSRAMPRVRSSRRAPSRSTLPSAPPASDEITEASLRALSVYDLRHRCTNAGLDNSGRKADLVARLLEHHNVVSSQPGPSTSGQPPLQRNNEDQSRLLDHTLRDTIRSEVTACVTAAVQNLLPSSSSTIDLTGNAGLLRPTHGQIGSRSTSVSLPTASVPSRTADRILRGEYIDVNDLLPEALGLAQHPAGQLRLQIGDHGAVLLADQGTSSTRVKRHVHDFSTWMEAWTTYLYVLVSSAPERAPELLAYQAIITDANQKFRSDGWLAYDSQFRAAASNNRGLRWDVVDPTLWQLTITGTKRSSCFNCHLPHPQGAHCPFRPGSRQSSGFAARSTASQEICHNYNFRTCFARQCHRAHTCLSCGGKHPRSKCSRDPQRSATPQQS